MKNALICFGIIILMFCKLIYCINMFWYYHTYVLQINLLSSAINTLWTGDADLRLYVTTVQDG